MSGLNYGLDAELAAKEAAKYDHGTDDMVCAWVSAVSGCSKTAPSTLDWLKDGQVLLALGNKINAHVPGFKPVKANESAMPFKQMENIANFLKMCREYTGMKENDLFTTADLYDGKSIVNVLTGLIAVSRAANKAGFKGPSIAPKESKGGDVRHHEVGRTDAAVSKLNMGSAGVMERMEASQSNSIDFGNKSAGGSGSAEASKLSMGSKGIMERAEVSKANDINFGAKAGGKN